MLNRESKRGVLRAALVAVAATSLVACGDKDTVQLTGAGATFPYPIYSKWFDAFYNETGHQVNYQSIGSGAGVKQFTEGTVDFGATDGPMTDEEIAAVGGAVVHLPTVLGADVVTWNLPSLGETQLRFDGATLADIFLGKIKRWDDPRLAALNPGVALPSLDILVVHRADGSGTTFIWTDYLSTVSPEWSAKIGRGKSVNWPTGVGGKGNEGVTQQVKQVEGTIGYVELIYASANGLPYGAIKNRSGQFVLPTLESVSAAAAGVDLAADTDFRVSIVDAAGADAYPVASFTWLLVRPDMADAAKARAIRDFLRWMTRPEAAAMAAELHYAPLPKSVADLVAARIETLTAGGAPIADGR
ncbi:MAG TPA: phosphate ABC transporter substrate-binding protein PstS [Gemmatimonadaceae bacterium]|jgi:phosphate transport system substrate-binding protein|nr:phosphate ABC transporter substrate-binding protein PstS [Gemmatimonadaceae bacterium]